MVENTLRIADPYSTMILDEYNDKDIEQAVYPNIPAYPVGKTSQAVSYVQLDEAAYTWQVNDFAPVAKEKLVIYEILVRDFDASHDFKYVMSRLDYLQELGVNAIELMPVQEFDGNSSWGYNPAFHMALDKYYGTRNDLKALVDACHSRGIAVLLDVVYNHATGQNPYFRMYNTSSGGTNGKPTADSPFFNQEATHSYSVFNDFNHQKSATQEYVKRTTQYWINEFKIDGFRWDLTKGFTQNCSPQDEDCTNAYQADRVAVLKKYADDQWAVDPDFYIIFEHLGENKEEKQWADYRLDEGQGIMLWDKQTDAYNQATMGYDNSDFSGISYKAKGFDNPAAVGYMESHDEERLMYKNEAFGNSSGTYNVKELTTALDRMKAAGAFFFTVPGPKMIWQFGELGYDTSIFTCTDGTLPQPYGNDDCKLSEKPAGWDLLNNVDRVSLYDTWKKMISLKLNEPIFSTSEFTLEVSDDNGLKRIQLTDPDASGEAIQYVTVLGNFGVTAQNINPQFQEIGIWYDLMDGTNITVSDKNALINLAPGEYYIYANERATLGIDATEKATGFTVYPNPAGDFFRLSEKVERLEFYDISGKLIKTFEPNDLKERTINISIYNSGVYILKAEKNRRTETTKLIIN